MKPFVLLALTLVGASPVTAANPDSVLSIPRTAGAPQLANFLGMSPAGENAMAKVRGFVQRTPRDGDESTQRTDVYLSLDNEESYWPSYSSRIEGRWNQAGLMTGSENVSPGRNVQLIPYAFFGPSAHWRSATRNTLDSRVMLRNPVGAWTPRSF